MRPARGRLAHTVGPLAACAALLLGALAAACAPSRANAQAPAPPGAIEVTTTTEPEEPRVGERVRVVVEVTHDTDRLVVMTEGLERQPGLEVITTEPPTSLPRGDRLTTTFAFVVQPFALGPVDLGAVTLQLLAEDGSTVERRQSLPAIAVRTTVALDQASLRPLKPQATVPGAPPAWVRPALTGGGLAVLVGGVTLAVLYSRTRLRAARRVLVPSRPPTPAEDEARRELDAVRALDLLAIPDLEAYYGRLSSVVRGYLQDRFDFRATALTRSELERRMTAEGLDRWQARLVTGLLERCDAAVYARVYPPLASADHDLTVAYEIVELARPQREVEAEAVPA